MQQKKRRRPVKSIQKRSKFTLPRWIKRPLLILAPFAIIALIAYVAYQDYTVRQQF